MSLRWGFFCSCVLLCPEGHHILWAPEALYGHRHRGDCAGRRHSALREESLQEDVLSGYFRVTPANCPTVCTLFWFHFKSVCYIQEMRTTTQPTHCECQNALWLSRLFWFSTSIIFLSCSGHQEKMMHLSPTLQWDREKCEDRSHPQDPCFLYSAPFRFNWK